MVLSDFKAVIGSLCGFQDLMFFWMFYGVFEKKKKKTFCFLIFLVDFSCENSRIQQVGPPTAASSHHKK